jgi:hypothetical protein
MSDYHPDKWVGVKISGYKDSPPIYKIFACWYGGYAGSDSWKLNSGITKATLFENCFQFEGSSGSVYFCGKHMYGTNLYGHGVLSTMISQGAENGITIEILPEDTNWLELNYE